MQICKKLLVKCDFISIESVVERIYLHNCCIILSARVSLFSCLFKIRCGNLSFSTTHGSMQCFLYTLPLVFFHEGISIMRELVLARMLCMY